MSKTRRALPFFLGSILVAMIWVVLWFLDLDDSLLLMTIFLPPFSALASGTIGVAYFSQEGVMREDRFHMMNLMLALALIVFAIAETATGAIGSSETGYLAIILMQLPGLLLVALGVARYLRVITEVLNRSSTLWWRQGLDPSYWLLECYCGSFDKENSQRR
jgi:hypothetical protein